MKLLCLSNGHGEDAIAVRILQELQEQPHAPEIAVLPLVGEGRAYEALNLSRVGPVQAMPSGGFIYMDGRQLARDLKGGLLQLTLAQLKAVRAWSQQGGSILAVGDIVPLLFAWWSGANYAFVGTAKSEYYLRDEAGSLPRTSWFESLESWSGSVYLPWERCLMSHRRCKAVFPRDTLTTQRLKRWSIPAFDLGNPMMDGVDLPEPALGASSPLRAEELGQTNPDGESILTIVLMPGSRPPEAYANWQQIVQAVAGIVDTLRQHSLLFLGAIAPGLDLATLGQILESYGWRIEPSPDLAGQKFKQKNATLILKQTGFGESLQQADLAIAMAGTATEQFVGLGKPAITLPGQGPQFTPAFAEAQTRLLGPSVTLVEQPTQVAPTVQAILRDPDRLHLISENGRKRMGTPGAARRIAECLVDQLLSQD